MSAAKQHEAKPRSLRRNLVITFTIVSLMSVLLLGVLNYLQAREMLTESVSDQLVNQQTAKARAIRNGIDRLEQTVVVSAQSRRVVEGVIEFAAAYDALDGTDVLDQAQTESFDAFYSVVTAVIGEAGVESIAPDDLDPGTDAARYLQYHYIVSNPHEERSDLVSAPDDASDYGAIHEARHPALDQLRSQLGFGDLLLVDTLGNIVYSTAKRLDFATNVQTGPYRTSSMAEAVTSRIAAAPVGDAVFVGFELYLPARAKPSMFVAAAIRDEARTVGALLVEIPIEALNDLTIGDGNWQENGFGDTAEVYVVGRDNLMRTDSRLWIEDPAEYLRKLDGEGTDPLVGNLIETFGSTALLQPVETKAVAEALDGEQFLGGTTNYLGQSSLSAAGPVGADQVDWVVVAEISRAEANDPLLSYVTSILIAGLLLIPIVIVLALFFADRMTKPVRPVVEAAAAVAGGDLTTTLPDLGRNEFGDVARRLNRLTAALREKEDALAAEEQEIKRLLLSVLPTRLVAALRQGDRKLLDLVDTATVVALDVDGMVNGAEIDEESGVELSTELSQNIELIAERLGVERVRSSTEQHVFAAGLDTPETAANVAARFTLEAVTAIEDLGQSQGINITYRAGMSAGNVIAGLLSAEQLTYGVFGDPPRAALALAGIAAPNQILIDADTAGELDESWTLEPATDLIDLRGDSLAAMVLTAGNADGDAETDESAPA